MIDLQKEYEKILQDEYQVDPALYEIGPANFPVFDTITEAQDAAIAQLQHGKTWKQGAPNFYWRRLLKKLLDCLPENDKMRSYNIAIGQVPDKSFDAEVRSFSNTDYLILINESNDRKLSNSKSIRFYWHSYKC